MDGNTVLQTVLACKFTHPAALQSLRVSLGLPEYQVSSEDDATDRAQPVVADPAAVPPHCRAMHSLTLKSVPAVPASSAAVAAGSPEALHRLALLALSTAACKTTDLARRVLLEGDIQEDEDYQGTRGGMDLVNTLTFDETVALLMDAEAALLASAAAAGLPADCTQAAAVDVPPTTAPQEQSGPLPGGFTAEQAADALSKGTGLLAEAAAGAPLEAASASPPSLTLPGGKSVQCTSWHGYVQMLQQLLAPQVAAELQQKSEESVRSLTVLALQVGWRPPAADTGAPDLSVTGSAAGPAAAPPATLVQPLQSGGVPAGLSLLQQYVDMPPAEAAALERTRLAGAADHATAAAPQWQPLAGGAPAIKALLARVRFARFMLAAYIHMHHGLDAFYDSIGRGLPVLAQAAAELQRIIDTSPLVQAGEAATKDATNGIPASVPGVDPLFLAPLLGAAPTRFKPFPGYSEALETMQTHLTHVGYIMAARLLVAATPERLDLAAAGVTVPVLKAGKQLTLEKLVALLSEGGPPGGFTSQSGPGLPWAAQEPTKWAAWSALRESDGRPSVTLRGVANFQDLLVKGGANCIVRSMMHLLVLQQAPAVHSGDWEHPTGFPQAPSFIPETCIVGQCVMGTHSMDELVAGELQAAGIAEEFYSVPEAAALVQQILPQVFLTTIRMHLCTPNRRRCTFASVLRDWMYTLTECESLDQVICEYFIQSVSGVLVRDPKALDAVVGSDAGDAAVSKADATPLMTVPVPFEAVELLKKAKRQEGQSRLHWVRALLPATLNQHIQRVSWMAAYWVLRMAQDHVASSFEEGLLYQGELPAACLHMENFGKQLITIDDRQRMARVQLSMFRKRQAEAEAAPAAAGAGAAAGGASKKAKGKKGGKKGGKGGHKKAAAKGLTEVEGTGAAVLPPLSTLPRSEIASLFMHEARSHAVFHRSLFTLLVGSIKARALNMGLGPYITPKGRFIHRYRELFEQMGQSLFALTPVTLREYQREIETVVRHPVTVAMSAAAGSASDALRFSREAIDAIAKAAGGTSRDLHNLGTAHDMLLHGLGQRQERVSVLMQATEALLSAAHSALGEKETFGKKADVTFGLVAAVEDKELVALRQEQAAKLEAEKTAQAELAAAAAADSAEKGTATDAAAPAESTPAAPPAAPTTVEEAAAARAARRKEFQEAYQSMRRRQIEAVKKIGAGPAALQLAVEVDALPGSSKAHPITNRYMHLGLAAPVVSLEPGGDTDWVPTSLT